MSTRKSNDAFYAVLWVAFLCALIILVATHAGCASTVTPDIVTPKQASYSGGVQNSGLIAATPAGRIIDGNLRTRYNAAIERYGAEYHLKPDEGLTPLISADAPDAQRWLVDLRHWSLFLQMNEKLHSGIAPRTP